MPATLKYGIRATADPETPGTYDFILSDETQDRVGDVIEARGWKLTNFRKNPVALYGHDNSRLPIGKWVNVRVEKAQLIGTLQLAPEGTNSFTDAVRKLLDLRMLNACSVGFHPIKADPLDPDNPWGAWRYKEQELLECSVVTVPANPNATVQRALSEFPAEVKSLLLAASGTGQRVSIPAVSAAKSGPVTPNQKGAGPMTKLAELIQQDRDEIIALHDKQAPFHTKIAADEDLTDDEAAEFDQIEADKLVVSKRLAQREATEKAIGQQVATRQAAAPGGLASPALRSTFPAKSPASSRERPLDLLVKLGVVHLKAFIERRNVMEQWKESYPERQDVEAIVKAVTNPAQTTVAGWAAELVETATWDFIDALRAISVYGDLAPRGVRFTFGRNGQLKIPRRNGGSGAGAAPDLRGAFVGEGQPIPVRRGSFGAVTLVPHKMGVISTYTREMAQYSNPQIEGLIREGIIDDTAYAIDTALLDAVAGDAIRPAGLGNGVVGIPGAAGGDIDAVTADVAAAILPFVAANAASGLVWLVNPAKAFKLQWLASPIGTYPFREQAQAGTLGGFPMIQSTNVGLTDLWLIRATDFASSTADTPEFDVSDVATIHEDDGGYPADQAMRPGTSTVLPLATGTSGAGAITAAPVRSLWQTASIGIRMLLGMDWAMRRAGMVTKITGVTW